MIVFAGKARAEASGPCRWVWFSTVPRPVPSSQHDVFQRDLLMREASSYAHEQMRSGYSQE